MTKTCRPTASSGQACAATSVDPVAAPDPEELARMCKALAHPARIRLFMHLAQTGSCYFGNLADIVPLAPSTISQHVSILKEAGLIEGSSDVTRVCYCVNPARLAQLKALVGAL